MDGFPSLIFIYRVFLLLGIGRGKKKKRKNIPNYPPPFSFFLLPFFATISPRPAFKPQKSDSYGNHG
jgi:hypothetical protein